jgi:hypothetical protein
MTKFIDTLVRLPNLRTLELLDVTHRGPVTRGLKRKCARFPSIREMAVCSMYPDFIRSCPNLESLTFRRAFVLHSCTAISSYGAGLKRVVGVDIARSSNVECKSSKCLRIRGDCSWIPVIAVVQGCPNLQEISLGGAICVRPYPSRQRRWDSPLTHSTIVCKQ